MIYLAIIGGISRDTLEIKNAAAPYWGDGGRGSTQFRETLAPLNLNWPITGPAGPS